MASDIEDFGKQWSDEDLALQENITRAERLNAGGAPMGAITRGFIEHCKRLLKEKYNEN